MDIAFYSDLTAFRQQAAPLLKSHCAVNSLKLGLLEYYCNHERTDNPVFAVGIEHGEVIAVFIQTRSLYFFADEAYFSVPPHGLRHGVCSRGLSGLAPTISSRGLVCRPG